MSDQFLGEIRMFCGNFPPRGWAFCNGQVLPISQNTALFSLLGTNYGGDGRTNFALPDLQGRIPIHSSNGGFPGENGGDESVAVSLGQIPAHTHTRNASGSTAVSRTPDNQLPAVSTNAVYGTTPLASMAPAALGSTGGNQPHENMQPFLCVTYIIAMQGIYPSRP